MPDASDLELLRDYDRQDSEDAFAALVQRHIHLVYSVALRHVGIAAQAEEITQAVFIILARKAAGLRPGAILEGWLHETTRLTALSFLRGERRRHFREQEAYMQSALQESGDDPAWNQLAPLLDEAVSWLGKKDRDAVTLRFFKEKSLREVAAALNVNETAAQRRVHRAVEKLRRCFTKRGVALSSVAITAAISANSIQAAPVALAKSVTAVAIVKGSIAAASTLALVKGTMKIMTWIKIKFALGVSMAVLLAGGAATIAISQTTSDDKITSQEIIKKSQDTYASLSSYSDEGKTVSSIGRTTVAPHTFTIKLARPNLYRIEWQQETFSYNNKGIVWSAGDGDFLKMGDSIPQKSDREGALSGATGISGGAAASIPGTFFKMNWGNQLGGAMQSAKRKSDEKIGDTDCYVLTETKGGRTRTLWIGKQDYLIHQIENDTSAASLKAALEDAAKKHPEMRLPTSVAGDSKSVETHVNIVFNKPFSKADFDLQASTDSKQ
jgi:RNA polymerase sigma factor (sigma-70 family)